MTENIRQWLKDMYADEIDNIKGTISNDKLWILGASNADEAFCFETNMREHIKYLSLLESLYNAVDE